ncbi:hypothetical protein D9M71_164910 [compost metagenome]
MLGAQAQGARNQGLLDAPVTPVLQQVRQIHRLLQRLLAAGVIHGTTVVRVDQAEVPEIVALIQIRHAGHGHAQQGLRQTIECAGGGNRTGSLGQGRTQQLTFGAEQQALDEVLCRLLVRVIGRAPAALQFGFTQGLALPLPDTFCVVLEGRRMIDPQLQRPTAENRLVQNHFIARRWHLIVVAQGPGEGAPQADLVDVPGAALAQYRQPRP